ncbi:MAG: protein translocase subunit SecD [Candidatus Omnitrophica bacterium]|nr:protein translocase subunit SecD [Candidatus Omnitrophota bacterium]
MYKNLNLRVIIIIIVVVLASAMAFPLEKKINLGLDLKGGMHLVMRVDDSKLSQESKKDAVDRALEVIRNRIDEFGVKEPTIQRQGKNGIIIQLPGITERGRAIDLIGQTALLEFKLVNNDPNLLKKALASEVPDGFEFKYLDEEPILVEKKASLTGESLVDATVRFDQTSFNEPMVSLQFNSKGAKEFAEITKKNIGRRLAIILDGKIKSAPRINEAIPSGEAVITGRFTQSEAKDLAIVLRVGALPAPLYIEEERTIGPLLGQDSIKAGINATIMGAVFVFLFMLVYYMVAGLIANLALLLNLLIIFAGLSMFGFTLTLPGIAGIVLTLGMAVDANVLINERIKEELALGRSLPGAIANGYRKALGAIIDSNVTTIIAATLLVLFGTGPIRGFAITLSIGLLASLFTAVIVTRTIFELLLKFRILKNLPMLQLFRKTNVDFLKIHLVFFISSLLVIVIGLGSFLMKGNEAFGIDFAGGQLQEYRFKEVPSIDNIRSSLKEINLGHAILQQFKSNPKQIAVRTKEESLEIVSEKFKESFPDNQFEIVKVEKVGPLAGGLLKSKAIKAIIFSLAGILLYIGFRFRHFDFAFAGIIALLHDILIALGLTVMSGRSIDLLIVTAFLTIAGYSINDTIVIFDRIREVSRTSRKITLKEIINLSVNQTLSRTILTTVLTLIVVVSLFLFGGEVLNNFAFCLLVGFVSGTYSTIFIASPLVLILSKRASRKRFHS